VVMSLVPAWGHAALDAHRCEADAEERLTLVRSPRRCSTRTDELLACAQKALAQSGSLAACHCAERQHEVITRLSHFSQAPVQQREPIPATGPQHDGGHGPDKHGPSQGRVDWLPLPAVRLPPPRRAAPARPCADVRRLEGQNPPSSMSQPDEGPHTALRHAAPASVASRPEQGQRPTGVRCLPPGSQAVDLEA
jgi:hypothetical protein